MAFSDTTLIVVVAVIFLNTVRSAEYILGHLNKCTRVPDEPPCNIPFGHFVPDYASQRYQVFLEIIYRKAKDISRFDSRAQCVNAYKAFLCSQLFPKCSKIQTPRFYNLKMQRWVVHDPAIRAKCNNIFATCNERVATMFMSPEYFMCDHLDYTPYGWESNRCVPYDLDTRCGAKYGKLPLWYLNYHDQNLIGFLNATLPRLHLTLPEWCMQRLMNVFCRHPVCSEDSEYMVTNYTRQQCDSYLKCARFVPGEVNVDALCLVFPSSTAVLVSCSILVFAAFVLQQFTLIFQL